MELAIQLLVPEAAWKLKAILRCRRFFDTQRLIQLFKSHILGFLEYRTPAILHASSSVLAPLDHIFDRFIGQLGISSEQALLDYSLAPLSSRRDIAALGIIQRSVLGLGPHHLRKFFQLDPTQSRSSARIYGNKHSRQLLDPFETLHRDYINRSILGYIWIYNLLPSGVVVCDNVQLFQSRCQQILKVLAKTGCLNWAMAFSPRVPRNLSLLIHYNRLYS